MAEQTIGTDLQPLQKQSWFTLVGKTIGFWALFMVLHFVLEQFPNESLKWLAATNESIYQHLKIAFFAYLATNLVECSIAWRGCQSREALLWSRLFGVVTIPWIIFIVWFAAPALYGQIESMPIEIAFSTFVTVIAPVLCIVIEVQLQRGKPNMAFKILTASLFILSLLEFVIFSYRLPWVDMFKDPLA